MTVWTRFVAVFALCVLYLTLAPSIGSSGAVSVPFFERLMNASEFVPGQLIVLLPIIGLVALTNSGSRRPSRGNAITLCVVSVCAVVLLDEVDAAIPRWRDSSRGAPAVEPVPATLDRTTVRGGSLRAGIATLITNDPSIGDSQQREYSSGHPRLLALGGIELIVKLLMPIIVIGAGFGALAWIDQRATFRRAKDEAVARWLTALILGPAIVVASESWSRSIHYNVLFSGHVIWEPMIPVVPMLWLAWRGWKTTVGVPSPALAVHTES
jgi:hypothetical protein